MKTNHTFAAVEILIVVIVIVISLFMLLLLEEPETKAVSQYCEMTQLYIDSNGENGWPDYNRNRATACPTVAQQQ